MTKLSKLMGFFLGASAAATMGVAMAQSVPPQAEAANPALGAGQQSVHGTPMGETGVSEVVEPTLLVVPVAVVEPAQTVVVVPEQPQAEPSTMGAGPAEAAPAPIAQAPETQRSEPMVEPRQEPMRTDAPRADRN